jgi:hypothetical protein
VSLETSCLDAVLDEIRALDRTQSGDPGLFVGLSHLVWPSYGGSFLDVAASIYPGFHPAGGVGAIMVGTLYALLDGAFGGAVIAWLYNRCTRAV